MSLKYRKVSTYEVRNGTPCVNHVNPGVIISPTALLVFSNIPTFEISVAFAISTETRIPHSISPTASSGQHEYKFVTIPKEIWIRILLSTCECYFTLIKRRTFLLRKGELKVNFTLWNYQSAMVKTHQTVCILQLRPWNFTARGPNTARDVIITRRELLIGI